ncbi:MAG: T9SS type A sorting domain-containing protein [Pyrinomonadaceae bacterium]|nr:T9SS type A sorting domain-containing protein [Sphingobacteriaceae bacterium]
MNQTSTSINEHDQLCSADLAINQIPQRVSAAKRILFLALTGILLLTSITTQAQRKMENLGRGTVAMRKDADEVFVSWRILGLEFNAGVKYNLYRGTTLIASNLNVSNFTDVITTNSTYQVAPVVGGVVQAKSPTVAVTTTIHGTNTLPCLKVPIRNTAGYTPKFIFTGDLDGNGELDFVFTKQPDDPAKTILLEAYTSKGVFLWQADMGPNSVNKYNIEPGSSTLDRGHGDNFTVYDLNSDGKAEVIVRIANGVKFGDGTTFTYAADNNRQFISILNGMTGAQLAYKSVPTNFLSDGPMNGHMGIAYIDGVNPSVIWESKNRVGDGDFNQMITAYTWLGGNVSLNWTRLRPAAGSNAWPDGHQIRCVDVNGDGKDDVLPMGHVINGTNGTVLYSLNATGGVVHGDRFQVGDFDPSRPGLEGYNIQQNNPTGMAWSYYDAKTGQILKKQTIPAPPLVDYGRGLAGDFDPTVAGWEFWTFTDGMYNINGSKTSTAMPASYPNMKIWWDGDVLSENLDNGKLSKWDHVGDFENRLYTFKNYIDVGANVPGLYGDILGDWREEIVYLADDKNSLLIFTPITPTSTRLYTLLHNPEYRLCLTSRGYYASTMTDFYLGNGMATPPTPNIVYANRTTPTGTFQTAASNESVLSLANLTDLESNSEMVVYPNPSSAAFKVTVGGSFDYVIYDQAGNKVEAGNGSNSSTQIGASLKPAIYILNVTTSVGETKKYKLIKQ